MNNYTVFEFTDDGVYVRCFKHSEEVNEYLQENFSNKEIVFLRDFPRNMNEYSETGIIILQGKVVLPKPIEIVKLFQFEK